MFVKKKAKWRASYFAIAAAILILIGAIFAFQILYPVQEETPFATQTPSTETGGGKTEETHETEETSGAEEENSKTSESVGESPSVLPNEENLSGEKIDPSAIPSYTGSPFVVLQDNKPSFALSEITATAFESYSSLDALGRCGIAFASCGKEIMPKEGEERGSISSIKPSGWVQAQYDNINGKYLYNRCHLIGWQLSAENANKKNLITGTKYFNVDGMLPFENMIADYIKETGNHVMYRVTPVYQGNDLVASGVQLEAYSVEDGGEGVCFNVYCYNVQPGIQIDYATGKSSLEGKAM